MALARVERRVTVKITRAALDAFEAFHGDVDGWARSARCGTEPDTTRQWPLIDELLMGLALVASAHAAPAYRDALFARMAAVTANQDVNDRLLSMASRLQGGKD